MAKKQPPQEVFEEQEGSTRLIKVLSAVALYGVALLLGYIVVATPESGTAMGAIRNVLIGLGGSLAVVIPIALAWIATLISLSAAGKKVSVWRSAVGGTLFVLLMTAVHLFSAETIVYQHMTILGFANFVSKSYGYGHGGGAIGALLAWPLYQSLGTWGGFLAALLLALLALTATGYAARIVRWAVRTHQSAQHRSEQRRFERENEQLFEYDEPAPLRREPKVDRYPDSISVGGTDFATQPRRRRNSGADEDLYPPRPAGARYNPDEPMNPPRRSRAAEIDDPARKSRRAPEEEDLFDVEVPTKPRRRAPAEEEILDAEAAPKSRRRKPKSEELYNAAEPSEEPAPKSKKRKIYRENIESPAEDTLLDDLPAEDPDLAIFNKKPSKGDFKPDTSASVEKMRGMKARENQLRMSEEDLTIEPDHSEVLENDDPPFDVPVKKPRGKLKRPVDPAPVDEEAYYYPPIDLLEKGESVSENHRDRDMEKAALLESTLREFGIDTKLTGIAHGPAVTRFELSPAPGVKVSRITALSDDIAMRLAAMSVRIEAPIPGKAAVGVEIPNEKVEMVRLRDVLESREARDSVSKIAVGMGKDNSGRYIVADIAKMPHVLIAGQTGSGKSVCINSIISSILFRATPDEVRLILIDPKMVELSVYNDIPHLVCPVVTDCKKAASALDWAVAEMSMRYKRFAERGVRDIKGYNKELQPGEKPMPQMVIIIDELADLMMVAPGEVEDSICRLAQLARAAGMHLVIATQRPSVNVITGIIKANIPTRIAFSVASQIDSRTMIDHGGAEKLLGNGDMLFVPNGINKPMRVQGAWVSDEEVHAIVSYIKERSETAYDANMIEQMDNAVRTDAEKEEFTSEYDPRLPEAVEIVVEAGQASVSMLQRRMRVGYARAGRLIDEMEQRGIVSEADGAKPRTVLITKDEMEEMFEEE